MSDHNILLLLLLRISLLSFVCTAWTHTTTSYLHCLRSPKTIAPSRRILSETTRLRNIKNNESTRSNTIAVKVTSDDAADLLSVADGTTSTPRPKVRRQYETFRWNPNISHDSGNRQTYQINYRVEGSPDARPILLIHGFGANNNHYRFQFPALVEAGYRVYGIDLLGFGASDKPTQNVEYNFELFTELLVDFVNYIDQQQEQRFSAKTKSSLQADELFRRHDWVVAGNSIGGLLSLAVAQRLPDRVGGVVLFNCSGGLSVFRYSDFSNNFVILIVLWIVQQLLKYTPFGGNFFRDFKTRENVESILRLQGVYGNQENVNEELLEILLDPANDDGAQHVFLQIFGGPPGPTPESILPAIKCPILALWGEIDPWTPVDGGMHPGSKFGEYTSAPYHLVRLPGVGHCPHDEVPNVVNSKMIQWMKEELLPTTIESTVTPPNQSDI